MTPAPEPGKAEKQPDAEARRLAGLRQVLQVLGDQTATLKIGPDDTVTTTYAAMKDNLGAQTQATEQAGVPSYGGIDAKNVMELMRERALQDQQMRQYPVDMSQINYQSALAGQAQQQPQLKMADMKARFLESMLRNKTMRDVAATKAKGSPMEQLEFAGMFNLYKTNPEAAMIAMNPSLKPDARAAKVQYVDQLKESNLFTDKEIFTIVYTPNLVPEALAARIHEAQLRGGMGYEPVEKVGAYQKGLEQELTPAPTQGVAAPQNMPLESTANYDARNPAFADQVFAEPATEDTWDVDLSKLKVDDTVPGLPGSPGKATVISVSANKVKFKQGDNWIVMDIRAGE
jgi:hypothetical protein